MQNHTTRRIAMWTHTVSATVRAAAQIACTALALVALSPPEARAQAFVTGSANTEGFALIGYVRQLGAGAGAGHFMIIVHRDSPENGIAAAVCEYTKFTNVSIANRIARFRSVGACLGLTTNFGLVGFTSDNVFGIVDNGDPGAGVDTVDVNFLGLGGVAVPGSLLVDGNFIVR